MTTSLPLSLAGDKCSELDGFQVGQVVTITFDLQGTKYNDADGNLKYFTKVRGYKIELRQQAQQPAPVQQAVPRQASSQSHVPDFPSPADTGMNNDLPF